MFQASAACRSLPQEHLRIADAEAEPHLAQELPEHRRGTVRGQCLAGLDAVQGQLNLLLGDAEVLLQYWLRRFG